MTIVLLGEFTDLNTYIDVERGNRFAASRIKKEQTEAVQWQVKLLLPVVKYPMDITFDWFSKDSRKDPDNIAFAKKFILDGLVTASIIKGDSQKYISGFRDRFFIDAERPRVEIHI